MAKTVSNQGKDFIVKHEGGYLLNAYLCPAGIPTIGAGMTFYPSGKKVSIDDKISLTEAKIYFSAILAKFENAVLRLVKSDINQNQFDALVSFVYNIGIGAFTKSTLLKRVNENPNDENIKLQFLRWNKAGGRVLNGLTRRRKEEAELYFK
jgi:lysozyme